jgi:hypothetical protein
LLSEFVYICMKPHQTTVFLYAVYPDVLSSFTVYLFLLVSGRIEKTQIQDLHEVFLLTHMECYTVQWPNSLK